MGVSSSSFGRDFALGLGGFGLLEDFEVSGGAFRRCKIEDGGLHNR